MYPDLFGVIPMYALMWIVGAVFLYFMLEVYLKKAGFKKGLITGVEITALIAISVGIVFALLFQNLYDYIANPKQYSWTWDMTFYGGLIGGVISFLLVDRLWLRKQYGPHMKEVLLVAPSGITIMHAWGRIGCFFNGCCYGIESNAWYAMKFTTTDVKVLPINLWEASFLFLLSASLFFLLKKNFQFGFPVYLITYGVWRFAIEYLRGDDRGSFVPGISPSQFWSIIMIIGGVVYLIIQLYYIKKSKQNENPVE